MKIKSIKLLDIAQKFFMLYTITMFIFSFKGEYILISEIVFLLYLCCSVFAVVKFGKIRFSKNYIFLIGFVVYSYLSCVWAIDKNLAFSKSNTIFLLVSFSFITYQVFLKESSVDYMLKSILIAGLAMSIYSLFYYGFGNFWKAILTGTRLGSEINQANTFGMYAAITFVICIYFSLLKNRRRLYFISVLPFLTILASGSRTALVISFIGIVILFLLKDGSERLIKGILRSMFIVFLLLSILQLPIFIEATIRMNQLLNIFQNANEIDHSASIRFYMIRFGVEMFKKNPIFGYGADNARMLLVNVYRKTYLHNNYVELLVDYGIVGFTLYYGVYISIIRKLIQNIKGYNEESVIILSLLIMALVADYGTVFYYNKLVYIIFTLGFIHINSKCLINRRDN